MALIRDLSVQLLTTRDYQVLRDIWLYRYATTAQISRLHFHHLKIAQRRLRRLHHIGVVERFRTDDARPLGDHRWVYALSPEGATVVATREGLGRALLRPPAHLPRSGGFLRHHELITDTRIWLREACGSSEQGFACRFVPAYEEARQGRSFSRRAAVQVHARSVSLVPDGVFTIDAPSGASALFLLEVDRATEPLRRRSGSSVHAKLELFRKALDEGLKWYCELFGRRFQGARQLWVVPSEKRLDSILAMVTGTDLEPVVWASTADVLRQPGSLSSRVWRVGGRGPTHCLDE